MDYRKKTLVALDIGGTKTDAILWERGKIRRAKTAPTPKDRDSFLVSIFRLIDEVAGKVKVEGIGLSAAGAQDFRKGIILASPNMRFMNGFAFRKTVVNHLHLPVVMDNDTHCFLLAENSFGQARGKKNVVALTLGTGVGGAVLVEGKLLRGKHGSAGELGQVIVSGRSGSFLTIEDLISSHGFERFGVHDPLGLQITAERGNRRAGEIFKTIGGSLGVVLANYANIFDPELIVLGGGIMKAGRLLLLPALQEMKKHTILPANLLPPVKISRLKHAGALGAVVLFAEK